MNLVRSVISIFVVTLVVLSVAGWMWAGGQPAEKMIGARVALTLCSLASLGSLWVMWREKPASST